jgi:hypothetical protein
MAISICPDLRLVYDYEVAHGNTVARIDAPAGTECEYAIVFAEPLKIWGTAKTGEISPAVKYWECLDTHYAIEVGFYCREHRHSVAGPAID